MLVYILYISLYEFYKFVCMLSIRLYSLCTYVCIHSVHTFVFTLCIRLYSLCTYVCIYSVHTFVFTLYMLLHSLCTYVCIHSVHTLAYSLCIVHTFVVRLRLNYFYVLYTLYIRSYTINILCITSVQCNYNIQCLMYIV